MSLINEALKKARDKNSPSDVPQPLHAPLRPTSGPPPKSASNGMWVVAALVFLGLAGLFWFIFRSTKSDASHGQNLVSTQKPQQSLITPQPPPSGTGGPLNVPAVTPLPPVVQPPPPPPQQQIPVARLPRPSLRISATMVFKDSRTAIINGQEFSEGEEIEGATLIEIKLNGVRLRFNGEEYFLKNN